MEELDLYQKRTKGSLGCLSRMLKTVILPLRDYHKEETSCADIFDIAFDNIQAMCF